MRRLVVVVWRVDSLIGDAVAVSFIGFLLGEISLFLKTPVPQRS
jgi:hypothetical protein